MFMASVKVVVVLQFTCVQISVVLGWVMLGVRYKVDCTYI